MTAMAMADSEAASWRKLADNMRGRATVARPGAAKDILSKMADLFEDAAAKALRAEQSEPVAAE